VTVYYEEIYAIDDKVKFSTVEFNSLLIISLRFNNKLRELSEIFLEGNIFHEQKSDEDTGYVFNWIIFVLNYMIVMQLFLFSVTLYFESDCEADIPRKVSISHQFIKEVFIAES
jgi:hypothetical protein